MLHVLIPGRCLLPFVLACRIRTESWYVGAGREIASKKTALQRTSSRAECSLRLDVEISFECASLDQAFSPPPLGPVLIFESGGNGASSRCNAALGVVRLQAARLRYVMPDVAQLPRPPTMPAQAKVPMTPYNRCAATVTVYFSNRS